MLRACLYLLAGLAAAQTVHVPNTCTDGFEAGTDEVIYTLPYTYNQVLDVIGDFGDLAWSGNPRDTVTLNGTDNRVGTARAYTLQGSIPVVETLTQYRRPPCPGPYAEVHNAALVEYTAFNVSAYIILDGNYVQAECFGKAAVLNMTTHFCATNASLAAQLLHQVHMQDAVNVGKILGGRTFSSCEDMYTDFRAPVCPFGLPIFDKPGARAHW